MTRNYLIAYFFLTLNLLCSESYSSQFAEYFSTGDSLKYIQPEEIKLKNGKSFMILQSPESEYLFDVYVFGIGFPDTKDTILFDEIEHIDTIIIADIDNDGFEELYIFTRGFAPGAYDHVFGIASDGDRSYKAISFLPLKQEDIKEGGMFEGYNGKDVYTIKNNTLERTFPVHKQGDSYENPSGYKTILYTTEKIGTDYFYKIKD